MAKRKGPSLSKGPSLGKKPSLETGRSDFDDQTGRSDFDDQTGRSDFDDQTGIGLMPEGQEEAENFTGPTLTYVGEDVALTASPFGSVEARVDLIENDGLEVELVVGIDLSPVDLGVDYDIDDGELTAFGEIGLPADLIGLSGGLTIDTKTGEITAISGGVDIGGLSVEINQSLDGCETTMTVTYFGVGVSATVNNCEDKDEEDEDDSEPELDTDYYFRAPPYELDENMFPDDTIVFVRMRWRFGTGFFASEEEGILYQSKVTSVDVISMPTCEQILGRTVFKKDRFHFVPNDWEFGIEINYSWKEGYRVTLENSSFFTEGKFNVFFLEKIGQGRSYTYPIFYGTFGYYKEAIKQLQAPYPPIGVNSSGYPLFITAVINDDLIIYNKTGYEKLLLSADFTVCDNSLEPSEPEPKPPSPPPPPPRKNDMSNDCCRSVLSLLRKIANFIGILSEGGYPIPINIQDETGATVTIQAGTLIEWLGLQRNNSLYKLLREMANVMGTAETSQYPGNMPSSMIGETESPREINNLNDWLLYLHDTNDERWGQWDVNIQVKNKDGESKEVQLDNLAEAVAEMYGLLLQLIVNSQSNQTFNVKNLVETGLVRQQVTKSSRDLKVILDTLNFDYEEDIENLNLTFSIPTGEKSIETEEEFLEESSLKIPVRKFNDSVSLKEILGELKQAAAIIRAVHWRKLDPKRDMGKQVLDYLNLGLQIADRLPGLKEKFAAEQSGEEGEEGAPGRWDAWLEKIEEEWATELGREDGDRSDRPRIREVGRDLSD